MQAQKEKQQAAGQGAKGPKKTDSGMGNVQDARREMTKTKEQLEEEKKISLSIHIKPLELDGLYNEAEGEGRGGAEKIERKAIKEKRDSSRARKEACTTEEGRRRNQEAEKKAKEAEEKRKRLEEAEKKSTMKK